MNHLYYHNRIYPVPGSWNELSPKQLLRIVKLLYSSSSVEVGKLKLFCILSGWSYLRIAIVTRLFTDKHLDARIHLLSLPERKIKQLNFLTQLYAAIDEFPNFLLGQEFVDLTINKIPKYKNYYGPSDQLSNITIAEFTMTEMCFIKWKRSEGKEILALNELVAILYRPRRASASDSADVRVPFDPELTRLHLPVVAKWPNAVRIAIAIFYESCRSSKLQSNSDLFSDDDGTDQPLFGLWSLMRNVAKSGHFGDMDKVQNQYLDVILMELHEVKAEAEKLKSQQTEKA
jgi:hypothetical protein